MNSAAARTIQKGWRRTALRLGRLGESANKNNNENKINYSIMKNIPIERLHQILLRIARKEGMNRIYTINNKGHMIYHGGNMVSQGGPNVRMNRQHVIYNISVLTNIRPSAQYRNRAARVIQSHARGASARREASFRSTSIGRGLHSSVLNKIFRS